MRSILLFLLCFESVSFAQLIKFTEPERRIIRLQDERQGADSILYYLDSKDEKVAWRAAIALANIKDSSARSGLLKRLMKENRPGVLDAIAFALGVIGPDAIVFKELSELAEKYPSIEIFIAMGRTVTKSDTKLLVQILEKSTAPPLAASSALIEISIRKLMNDEFARKVDELEKNSDPEVRWRAIYAYGRTDDSSLLAQHFSSIKDYLGDIGSAEARMFAATALGRIHNDEAGKILVAAAKSEQEWRVRVNILNSIGKLPRFSSAIHDILRKGVMESSKENPVSDHVARTSLDVLDQMIVAGKISAPDSIGIREWLVDYLPSSELHDDQSVRIRSQCMIPLARLGADYLRIKQIASYTSYHDRTVEINVAKAIGVIPDTLAFYSLLGRVFTANPNDLLYILDGLQSLWSLAKKDTVFMKELIDRSYAPAYKHMLIRFASLSDDPAVVTSTLEQIKDSLITTNSLRKEAEGYLLSYLDKYAYPRYHDHIIAVLSAVAWLKPINDTFITKIQSIEKKALDEWGDQMVADSAHAALGALGILVQGSRAKRIREPIDWKLIEELPDTLLIPTQYGFMFLKLKTYEAPLTVLNMYKLAKINFFANNYFHRIVPNFVIQTGDNTGTGEGGPGYAIRTEIAPIRYDSTGAVGMASSGKDTEGSQWFVTHCPTPHLNTRYTIWGQIVKGRENIERYQLNDRIENIIPYK